VSEGEDENEDNTSNLDEPSSLRPTEKEARVKTNKVCGMFEHLKA
jgi:hypothetical protein